MTDVVVGRREDERVRLRVAMNRCKTEVLDVVALAEQSSLGPLSPKLRYRYIGIVLKINEYMTEFHIIYDVVLSLSPAFVVDLHCIFV